MSETPAGWYPNPENAAQLRYWDGAEWTQHTAAPVGFVVTNPYEKFYNLDAVTEERRREWMGHELKDFPTPAVVVLSILTLGFFGTIYHGLKHGKLPEVRQDDFGSGKAIGFLFIPFFNLYWYFVFWLRLADRINFQHRLRGGAPPVNRDLTMWTLILGVSSIIIPFAWIASAVMALIVAAQIQTAANVLAREEVQRHAVIPAAAPQATPPPPPPPPA